MQTGDEQRTGGEQLARAADLKTDHLAQRLRRRRRAEGGRVTAESRQVVGGKVNPAVAEILRDILAVFEKLERTADIVGERLGLRVRASEDLEHQPTDRLRRKPAVVSELVPVRVAGYSLITPIGLDQACQVGAAQPVPGDHALETDKGRVFGPALHREVELGLERVERRQNLIRTAARTVSGLIDQTRIRVDGSQRVARADGKDPKRYRKVLAGSA